MIGIKLRLFGSLLAAGLITLVAGAVLAFEITQSEGTNTNVSACVDVFKAGTSPGTIIQAYPCAGTKNEQWTLVKGQLEGTGNDGGVSTCMVAAAGFSGKVELEDCNSNPNTNWTIDGSLIPTTAVTETPNCLDSRGHYGSGAQLVVTVNCTLTQSQTWEFRDIVIVQPILIDGSNEHACVDVQGNSTANNTPVVAFPCTGGVNERWTFVNNQLQGNGGYGSSNSTQTCLTESTGHAVVLQTCNSNNGFQAWFIQFGAVVNASTLYCLDSNKAYNGVQLVDTPCLPGKQSLSQTWVLQ